MKLLAIDGNSIMNRAFYGIKALSNSKGEYTNALTGFMNIYLKELDIVKPDCAAVAFDLKAPTFRHKADPAYKAKRHGMPDELAQQMPVIKEMLGLLGIKCLSCEGWEADDILGTLSKLFTDGDECVILTGDRDSLQLITDSCTVHLATNKETINFTPERFREDYGFDPIHLIDLKALMGDSSDNIPGIKGVGEKTAVPLIAEFGSIENIYEHLDEIKLTPANRKKLTEGRKSAESSKFLATIVTNVPIAADKNAYIIGERDEKALKELLVRLEMNKLMQRLGLTGAASAEGKKPVPVPDAKPLEVAELKHDNIPDTKSVFTLSGGKLAVCVSDKVLFTHDEAVIMKYLGSEGEKACFDGKAAHLFAIQHGGKVQGLKFSCDIAGYLLNSQAENYLAENLCIAYRVPYRSDMGEYADVCSLEQLSKKLSDELEAAEMTSLYNNIELPLCEVLASMEYCGVRADRDGITAFGKRLDKELETIKAEIYELAGKEFNILSPKQLGTVLFEDMGLPGKKKTKTGYSTNAEVLEAIADKHPIINKILEYRTLSKLSSTYVDGLLSQIREDGRVHSVFRQTETRTGRISSTEPNMQNIPVRKPLGREMRRFFTAADGCVLVDADYSQIELRVLASVCGDENMRDAFLSGRDIHTSTAAQVFDVPEDFVDSSMRSAAKAVNFGIIYGIGAFSLSKDIGVSVAEAKRYIQNYLNNFSKVSEFMDRTVENAKRDGYVSTIFGRRRYIPELQNSNKNIQAFGKRAAMNAPIQGAAADIIKLAMVRVYRRLKEELPDVKLILQVHDELILEAPADKAEQTAKLLKEEMEAAVDLAVPMIVDVHTGKSWFDAKG